MALSVVHPSSASAVVGRQVKSTVQPLPILDNPERWDCHSCGCCCRGTTIVLSDDDLRKLGEQGWHNDPDLASVRITRRASLFSGRRILAAQPDGACVFLTPENRCRIHEKHGAEAKPAVCRMFPFEVIPLERTAYLTPRRSCPSAARDEGRPIKEHLSSLQRGGLLKQFQRPAGSPPPITKRQHRPWTEFLAVTDVIATLLNDTRYPLVRRLVHGLDFCDAIAESRFDSLPPGSLGELLALFRQAAERNGGGYFQTRPQPDATTDSLLRQTAMHFIRSHPHYPTKNSWIGRFRDAKVSLAFARGEGVVPHGHPGFPAATFEQLAAPLGGIDREVIAPLDRYFETQAVSLAYVVAGRRMSFTTCFRQLALQFPLALWLLRLASQGRRPTRDNMIYIIVALERGRGMSTLPKVAEQLAVDGQLQRLAAWYVQ